MLPVEAPTPAQVVPRAPTPVQVVPRAPTPASVVPRAPAAAPGSVLPAVAGALPPDVVLPPPPHLMRVEPLPPHLTYSGAAPARDCGPLVVGQEQRDADEVDEEEDEIQPVNGERAAQWRAYRAAGF